MNGRRRALIVACDNYEHADLRRLPAAAADAEALGDVLTDPAIGDFTVDMVRNEPAYVTQERIEDFLSDNRSDDLLLIHFSCHGLKTDTGELFFAARNTRPQRLRATAVPADFVHRCMQLSNSRSIVLLLDCCYGGAFPQGATVRAAGDLNMLDSFPDVKARGRGRVVITASGSAQYAFEGDALADGAAPRPSVFTQAVVDGLRTGDADRDGDGLVSLSDLYGYVCDQVLERNPKQTPSRLGETQGELYLARSHRRQRIHAAALPPDLDAARRDLSMYARRGAVSELRKRLASDDLQVAAGAWEALTELGSDIEYVAADARVAMLDVAVRTDPAIVDFGEVEQGSLTPPRTIRLLGPAIARACRLEPSHPWVRIQETPEGHEIWIIPATPGSLEGHITVKGPTGDAVIPVRARVSPAPTVPAYDADLDPDWIRKAIEPSGGVSGASAPGAGPRETAAGATGLRRRTSPEGFDSRELLKLTSADIDDCLKAGDTLRAGNRTLRAERTPGPVRFVIIDPKGKLATSDVRELPSWAVRELIEKDGRPSDSYDDPYAWAEAVVNARTGSWTSSWSGGDGRLSAYRDDDGPLRYVLTEGQAGREYASVTDVPNLDDFKADLLRKTRQRRDKEAIKSRLDDMLGKRDGS